MTDNDPHQPPPYVPGPNPGRVDQPPVQFQQPGQLQPWQAAQQQPMPMPYPPMQPAPMIKPKNPGVAAVLSFLIPGVGQLMNGDIGLGILMMILTGLAYASLFILIGFVLVPGMYIWSILQAYSKAKSWNVAHGIIS